MIVNATPGGAGTNGLKQQNFTAGSSNSTGIQSTTIVFREPGRYLIQATAFTCTSVSTSAASTYAYAPIMDGEERTHMEIDAAAGQTLTIRSAQRVHFILIKILGDWDYPPQMA